MGHPVDFRKSADFRKSSDFGPKKKSENQLDLNGKTTIIYDNFLKIWWQYSCAQNKPIGSHLMKQNANFQEGISQP